MNPLFEYPDTAWVNEARNLFGAHIEGVDLHEPAVDVCIAITNMMKSLNDGFLGRKNGMGSYMVQLDISHRLQHNPIWKVYGSEIITRYHNGLRRHSEFAEMTAAEYKPNQTAQDAEYIANRFAWIDALVFIHEAMGGNDPVEFRKKVRLSLYGE